MGSSSIILTFYLLLFDDGEGRSVVTLQEMVDGRCALEAALG